MNNDARFWKALDSQGKMAGQNDWGCNIIDADNVRVGRGFGKCSHEAYENAKTMAASGRLYQALEDLLTQIERSTLTDDQGHDFKINQAYLEARAAIASLNKEVPA